MSNNENTAQPMIKLCGLWKSQTKDGKVYYSGGLSYSTNLLLFPNSYKKEGDNNPDLIVYIGKKEKKEDKPKPGPQDPGDDDIPF